MPDPVEEAAATTVAAPNSQGTEEGESSQQVEEQPQQVEEKKEPTADDTTREFDITEVEIVDGKLVWKADPNDPNTTVYKADDLNGLFKEIAKGTKAKDDYIRELKTKSNIKPDAAKGKSAPEPEPSVIMPDRSAIVTEVAKKYGLDPAVLSWTNEDWKQYELNEGSVAANKLYRNVEAIANEAQAAYDQQTAQYINDRTLDEETDQVVALVKKYNLSDKFTDAEYDEILKAVYANPDNFNKRGVRKTGVIVRSVVEALDELRISSVKKETKENIEKETAKSRILKGKLTPPAVKTKTDPIPPTKAPTSIAAAAAEIMAEWGK